MRFCHPTRPVVLIDSPDYVNMSTLLLPNNLIEPFFSTTNESKEYFHSFSDSIINFGPPLGVEHNMNISSNVPQSHETENHSSNQYPNHSSLSDFFKYTDDTHFEDFNNDHSNICSPCILDDLNMDIDNYWVNKPPDQWQPSEVADWIRNWARRNEIQDIEVAHLLYNQMSGSELCHMQREYFTSVCPQYGSLIYDSLQSLLGQFRSTSTNYLSFGPNTGMNVSNGEPLAETPLHNHHSSIETPVMQTSLQEPHHPHHHQMHQTVDFFAQVSPSLDVLPNVVFDAQTTQLNYSPSYTSVSESDRESTSSNLSGVNERKIYVNSYYSQVCSSIDIPDSNSRVTNAIDLKSDSPPLTPSLKRNGRRGRPPKKEAKSRSKGNGKLWEFIRDLLLNPLTNPSLIRWERREDGIFKFIQSDKVAKMWGERKQNPRMTYEKLSRAMRYYYKSQVLLPVFGRRLVYKFGPNATGWRPHRDHV